MKRLLLVILFFNFVCQAQHVQINFVEGFVIDIINPLPGSPSQGDATTDMAVNAIFSLHGVYSCYSDFSSYPTINLFAIYAGNNIEGFIAALESNANVVDAIQCGFPYTYASVMYLELSDLTIGNPIGTNTNGNVITSNADLNLVFDNYQVKTMNHIINNHYHISFEGNINQLKNELDALENIIENTDYIGVPMLLSIDSYNSKKTVVYPNPFDNHFNIESSHAISNYSLYGISGKEIVNTNSKNILDAACNNLVSGLYVLRLESENGTVFNQKLIKK